MARCTPSHEDKVINRIDRRKALEEKLTEEQRRAVAVVYFDQPSRDTADLTHCQRIVKKLIESMKVKDDLEHAMESEWDKVDPKYYMEPQVQRQDVNMAATITLADIAKSLHVKYGDQDAHTGTAEED